MLLYVIAVFFIRYEIVGLVIHLMLQERNQAWAIL